MGVVSAVGGRGVVSVLGGVCCSLTPVHQDMATQSRVRRLIGRRRAGLDRYIGVLSREVGSGPQDNVDPITELLTQLSGWLAVAVSSRGEVCVPQVPTVGVEGGTAQGREEEVGGGWSASFHRTSSNCWISRNDRRLSEALL